MLRFEVTTDRDRIDFDAVYHFLDAEQGIPRDLFDRAMRNALCFAGHLAGEQIAFARVITDCATFANLVDVFVVPEYRGNGYATRLLEAVFSHPDLQGLRRFTLVTRDKHGLYEKFGFHAPLLLETLLER
jgi:GNAT superfamily N-acetyltransferase